MKSRLFFFLSLAAYFSTAQTTIIPVGSSWKYQDLGLDLGTSWTSAAYSDAAWASGNAEFGYGEGDENTVVSYGPSSSDKYITTYFRKTFFIASVSAYTSIELNILRDDGAVIYVNGVEVIKTNMPSGSIFYNTLASGTIAWPFEDDWHIYTISPLYLVNGNNVISVEIHQDDNSSSDISFDLELKGFSSPSTAQIVRGPYLQQATSGSMIVKWRTDIACDAVLDFGLSPTSLTSTISDPAFTTEHEILVTGLSPSQKYFYQISNSSLGLSTPSDSIFFKTAPVVGTVGKYSFWVIGDAGTGNNNQRATRNGFTTYNQTKDVDGWIWLGDNAYDGGFDSEYQSNVFSNNTYEELLKKIVVWPAPGNHDYNNHIPFSPAPAYYDIFTLPASGECGGLASGTEKYYSYNYGNIHFVVMDSFDEDRDATAPMASWLSADLASNTLPWIIAYWHHPPYTKGSHDSDNPIFIDGELVDMRENILPILENYGVDLVLNGHSHSYERSKLIDGHYGYSSSFNASHIKDGSTGNCIDDCPYVKKTLSGSAHKGTVYAVVGCSGKLSSVDSGWPHPVMINSEENELGSLVIDIEDNRLDAKYIKTDGTIYDQFTIIKDPEQNLLYQVCPGDEIVLYPSWPGEYVWQPSSATSDSLTVTAILNTFYFVTDSLNCLKDTFNIEILPSPPCTSITSMLNGKEMNDEVIFIVTTTNQLIINCETEVASPSPIIIVDAGGKIVYSNQLEIKQGFNHFTMDMSLFTGGFYIVSVTHNNKQFKRKLIITK